MKITTNYDRKHRTHNVYIDGQLIGAVCKCTRPDCDKWHMASENSGVFVGVGRKTFREAVDLVVRFMVEGYGND